MTSAISNRPPAQRFKKGLDCQDNGRTGLSCLVGSTIGLPCDVPNHASYLQSWITSSRRTSREIFHAAADANRIADYILAFHPDYAETPDDPRRRGRGHDRAAVAA